MHVVLIETSGNQHYIFATNKLRENVGASELTYRVGIETVLKAVAEVTDNRIKLLDDDDLDGVKLRTNLLDKNRNPELSAGRGVEVITATSGKALLLVENEDIGERIVKKVTETALLEMPGLTVHGAISKEFSDMKDVHKYIVEVHRRLEREIRHQLPSREQRFLRLPFAAPCNTSALPASETFEFKNELRKDVFAFSNVTIAKRQMLARDKRKLADKHEFDKGRIVNLLENTFNLTLPTNLAEFELAFPGTDWVAIIHADGNGVGEIFLKFDTYSQTEGREYIETYRRFSLALDVCTINAAGYALKNLQNWFVKHEATDEIPVVPLVLGGDDLTLLCSGRFALKFTADFLAQFERETKEISRALTIGDVIIELDYLKDVFEELHGVIPRIANFAFGNRNENKPSVQTIGVCAGIAIIKPHYPFHQGYELAKQLLDSAKDVKTEVAQLDGRQVPASALDFHVLYDSAHSDLGEIRKRRLRAIDDAYLSAKPFVLTGNSDGQQNNQWLRYRKFDELRKRVAALSQPAKEDEAARALPNNKMHDIRESLFRGKNIANAEAGLVKKRLDPQAQKVFGELLINENSLFFSELTKDKLEKVSTHFLDAIEAVDFWKGFENGKDSTESEAMQ